MILMIDNYDSFTFNLVQFLGELGQDLVVKRNDEVTISDIENMKPDFLMISPGPCSPMRQELVWRLFDTLLERFRFLGFVLVINLLRKCLVEVVRAERLMHGKTSLMHHDEKTIFSDIPNPFTATRYHSLIVKKETLPDCLEVTSWTKKGELALRHTTLPIEGVQFHPESIMTSHGKELLQNFIRKYSPSVTSC